MARIVSLCIENFRGIRRLSIEFDPKQNVFCFVGRGDSGKSTILDAISFALSPSWNLSFHDTDFHQCDVSNSIKIAVSLIEVPDTLLRESKYGLHARRLSLQGAEISDEVTSNVDDAGPLVLTISLVVDATLEPSWCVTNDRPQEDKPINATDRAQLNCYLVSDYLDRHFSWNRGNPLNALQNLVEGSSDLQSSNVIVESLRDAKNVIDENEFGQLKNATAKVAQQAALLGFNMKETKTTLDFKDLYVRDNRVSLHQEKIPLRLMGKGSRRLASIAIQTALAQNGGIVLVDEVEQGLEPDRVKHLVRALCEVTRGQVFVTTHSREVITELEACSLYLITRDEHSAKSRAQLLGEHGKSTRQAVIRVCPEAFFATKVIVCEGKTEIGICRSLDKYRLTQGRTIMSFLNCSYVLGEGSSLAKYVTDIAQTGLSTSLLCDSDDITGINPKKEGFKKAGVVIFDCENDFSIEQQVFKDLPWDAVKELVEYAALEKGKQSIESDVGAAYSVTPLEDWVESESTRQHLGTIAKKHEWFKRIDHGEFFGDIIFKYKDKIPESARLNKILTSLEKWVEA